MANVREYSNGHFFHGFNQLPVYSRLFSSKSLHFLIDPHQVPDLTFIFSFDLEDSNLDQSKLDIMQIVTVLTKP